MTDPSAHSFEVHLERGDLHAAADWLVRAHGRDVLHLCTAIVRDRGTAEDLAQDAFGKAFQALPEFRGEASARTWLLTIARHRCLDHLRRSARQPWSLGREDDVREPQVADSEEALVSDLMARRADIREGLAVLSESERAMVLLRFAHGLSFDEIAESFGVKSGAVRMRVGRALSKMRDAIEGDACLAEPDFLRSRPAPAAPRRAPAASQPPATSGAPAPAAYAPPSAGAPPVGGPPRAPAPYAPTPGAPPPPAGPPPPMADAPRRVFPSFARILDVLRGAGPAGTASFSAGVDPGAALGELLLAFTSDASADDAFLARLGAQLPSRP